MGLNASPTCEIAFDDVRIGEDRLLGEEGDGWEQTKKTLDGGRISIAALSVGLAQGAYEAARQYSTEREQFGQPISEFDAVRNMVVGMHRKTERARLLTHSAATKYDRGESVARESALATPSLYALLAQLVPQGPTATRSKRLPILNPQPRELSVIYKSLAAEPRQHLVVNVLLDSLPL